MSAMFLGISGSSISVNFFTMSAMFLGISGSSISVNFFFTIIDFSDPPN